MPLFRKKPIVIVARQYDGTGANTLDIMYWVNHGCWPENSPINIDKKDTKNLIIETLEGPMTVSPGDWVIRGVKGEFYPCKPDVFEKSYEAIHDPKSN